MSRIAMSVRPGATFLGVPVEEFIIGLDRPLQHWFYQLWGPEPADPDADHSPLNADCLAGCSRSDLLEAIERWADLKCPRTNFCLKAIALDLCPTDKQAGDLPEPVSRV